MAGGPTVSSGGRRGGLPQTAGMLNLLTDMAFNLLIFFVVCASTEPEQGRRQAVPSANKDKAPEQQKAQNIEVALTRTTVTINGSAVPVEDLQSRLRPLLAGKTRTEDRIVVVRSAKDTPYQHWMAVTALIEEAGGVVALQLEEVRTVSVN